eukprot:TRINITY_DN19400_c0_g1_i1.p1 TRINITY_DN19400_c0_g1~~TRINITY_DN19400_c0_g1_i1.p1  ORF type:complete len:365 (+),score=100.69 TRINITY_DN19400_c0_g1_i1:46-1140(+)
MAANATNPFLKQFRFRQNGTLSEADLQEFLDACCTCCGTNRRSRDLVNHELTMRFWSSQQGWFCLAVKNLLYSHMTWADFAAKRRSEQGFEKEAADSIRTLVAEMKRGVIVLDVSSMPKPAEVVDIQREACNKVEPMWHTVLHTEASFKDAYGKPPAAMGVEQSWHADPRGGHVSGYAVTCGVVGAYRLSTTFSTTTRYKIIADRGDLQVARNQQWSMFEKRSAAEGNFLGLVVAHDAIVDKVKEMQEVATAAVAAAPGENTAPEPGTLDVHMDIDDDLCAVGKSKGKGKDSSGTKRKASSIAAKAEDELNQLKAKVEALFGRLFEYANAFGREGMKRCTMFMARCCGVDPVPEFYDCTTAEKT